MPARAPSRTPGRRAGPGALEQVPDLVGRERRGEVEALGVLAAQRLQLVQVGGGLHALRDHLHAEAVRQPDDRLDDLQGARVVQHVEHEPAVDLERVAREAVQEAQGRRARAEVVEMSVDAEA